jgi:hypothetical protein
MIRGLATRIQKLEIRRRHDDQMLLIWRMPGENIATVADAAQNAGLFVPGEKIISMEWLGEDPLPAPRWVQVTPNGWLSFTEREKEYCDCAVIKMAPKSHQPRDRDPSLLDWTNADLLYFIFRVDNEERH